MSKKKPSALPDTDPMQVVSGTECTGMIPTPPLTDGQADAYHDLHDGMTDGKPIIEMPAREKPSRQPTVGDPPSSSYKQCE